jgi:hypothetical protein
VVTPFGVVVPAFVARLTNPNTRSPVAAAAGPVPDVHAAVDDGRR